VEAALVGFLVGQAMVPVLVVLLAMVLEARADMPVAVVHLAREAAEAVLLE